MSRKLLRFLWDLYFVSEISILLLFALFRWEWKRFSSAFWYIFLSCSNLMKSMIENESYRMMGCAILI